MFPLLRTDEPNPLELFQIWLNLPAARKMVAPHFTMFWSQDIPRHRFADEAGLGTEVVCIAGALPTPDGPLAPLAPPPDSWASQAEADLAVWTLRLETGARWTLPAAAGVGTRRMLYFFVGRTLQVAGRPVSVKQAMEVRAGAEITLVNDSAAPAELLMLQGRPIGEPVAQYGPFVMNTQQELQQAVDDYRRTQFGGWPWGDAGPVHGEGFGRFARHADGRTERFDAQDA
jgi:redox-sensitive bicupin YhaK (pirin superfamily)